jgi:2-polyprenyl-3-methyl-5-hydroxy-6-metoxy-1,4-benzoquinol methylase
VRPTRSKERILDHGSSDPSIERQRAFWNTWNATQRSPEQLNDWTLRRGAAILALLESLRLDQPRIIDLGCGTGWLTEQLAALGPTTGIDLSDEVIAAARLRAPHVEFVAADLFRTELPEARFDVVVSQDVIAHVSDQPGFLERAARLLRPQGRLILTTTNRFVVERMNLPPQPPEHIERWLTKRSLCALLAPHFEVLQANTIMPAGDKGILRLVNSPRLNAALGKLVSPARLERLKERANLGYNVIALARRRV